MKHKLVRRKVNKRRNSDRPNNKRLVQPRSLEEFFAMPKQDQEIWTKASKAVTEVRAGASLRHASRELDLDPRKISQLARSGLRKMKNGRWAAKKFDRLLRVLLIPTREGLREIGVRDSRQATLLAKYWIAVDRYLQIGDDVGLREFNGQHIKDADGNLFPLLTELQELDRLASAGVLSFESLYARVA